MSKVSVTLGLPWYDGPDRNTAASQLIFANYLGRLQERLHLMAKGILKPEQLPELKALDFVNQDGTSEVGPELYDTEFEFNLSEETGCSLPGLARERCVDSALKYGADYILFFDDDMIFPNSNFLRLYLDQKDIVGALAFTGRKPITPVLYRANLVQREEGQGLDFQPIFDYERNALQRVGAVGFGQVLIKMDVFRKVPKPWFNTVGMGEDIFFSMRAGMHGFEVWADTRAKCLHVPTYPERFHGEDTYDEDRSAEVATALCQADGFAA